MADTDTLAPLDDTTKRLNGATATKPPPDLDHVRDMFGLGKMRQTLAADDVQVEATKPGVPDLAPPPIHPAPTDPLQAFGQPAMWLAMIGGLLTRHPLTSAITSAGAVMDSVHKQDAAAAQRAFDEWKINSENAMKLVKYEQDAYKAALAKKSTDVRESEAQIKTLAAAFKNPGLARVLEEEGMTGVTKYVQANGQQAERASVAAETFSDHAGKKISIAQGLLSDDPKQMADALRAQGDAFVHDASGKGSTSGSRMQADAIRLQLDTIAAQIEKSAEAGDQKAVDAAVAEARGIAGAGTASLKPPKAKTLTPAEQNVKTIADAEIARQENLRQIAGEPPLSNEAKAQITEHTRDVQAADAAATKAKIVGQTKQDLQPKKLVLNDDAVDFEAKQLLLTGQMPALGFSSGDVRVQIINRAAVLAKEQDHTVEDYMAGRAVWKADVSSLAQITKIADAVQGFENTALQNMKVAEGLKDKGAGTPLGPVVNRWVQAGRKATGDPDVAAFDTAMGTVSSEYGKIISGGSASIAATPEGAREEAAEWLNKIQSPEALEAQFAVARQDMSNRKNSLFEQRAAISRGIAHPEIGTISSGARGATSEDQPPVEGARKAPDGKWYVPDPARPGKYLEVQ